MPNRIVTAEQQSIFAKPEQQFRHNMAEVARPCVHESHRDRQSAIYVGLLRGDPAEIVEARQADMIDDKIQFGKAGRGVVDVSHVKGVAIERQDRRSLMHMNVLYSPLSAFLQIALRGSVR